MKKLLLIFALALPCYGQILAPILQQAPTSSGVDAGFDFRNNTAFVSDNTNCPVSGKCACVGDGGGTCAASGTWQGITYSWSSLPSNCRDRFAGGDSRLAGECSQGNGGGTVTFHLILPSTGTYTITYAGGDQQNPCTNNIIFKDNTTAFATYTNALQSGGDIYMDATGVDRNSGATWVSSNAKINHTFTSTTFDIVLGGAGTGGSCITHVFLHK